MVGTNAPTSSIGFAPIITVTPDMPLWQRVLSETVNWIDTNKKGMSFAFIIGSMFLSLWPLMKFRAFKSGLANSALGTILGAPLGVCVNCAAPVARSLHASGSALQTTLSALVASPTLNIVVLMMAFSVFPFYMAALKLALTFVFILVIVPLACHLLFKTETNAQDKQEVCEIDQKTENILPEEMGWGAALVWSVKTYLKNFLYLLKIALPLMLLSGVLGALLTVLIPWGTIESLNTKTNIFTMIGLIGILSIFGALLPSPMAFDVVVSAALLQAGVPVAYVSALLFTLGSFSIYAFFIIWQAISLRVASFMMLMTVLLGMAAGLAAIPLEQRVLETGKLELMELIKNEHDDPIFKRNDQQYSLNDLKPALKKQAIQYKTLDTNNENLQIEWTPFQEKSTGDKPFTFQKGEEIGMKQPYTISYLTGPSGAVIFSTMSIASGDVHNDGWPDVLVMGDHEVRPNIQLYANIDGKTFKRQALPVFEDTPEVMLVSLADLNADNFLDIVFTTFGGQNFVIYNKDGEFLEENLEPLGATLKSTTVSMSYGDIEGDGNIDIFLGNWSAGPLFVNYSRSENKLIKQEKDKSFVTHDVPGPSGETLTSLFTDINKDGLLDIYVGNDFIWRSHSDFILLGTKEGLLKEGGDEINKKFSGGQSTMSIDSGDMNNDMEYEYYIGQIAYSGQYVHEMSKIAEKQIRYEDYCIGSEDLEQCKREMKLKLAFARGSNFINDACDALEFEEDKRKCLLHLFMNEYCSSNLYIKESSAKKQLKDRGASERYKTICDRQPEASKERKEKKKQGNKMPSFIKASNDSLNNVLLRKEGEAYRDEANKRKVGFGAWTWNARWGDLDNDGWQDIYIANGYSMPMALPTNIFYRNQGDGIFEDASEAYGLESYTPTSAFTYLDIDNDGDLDIVTVPTDAPIEMFTNHNANNAIQFELRDGTSNNTWALGAEIQIVYEENERLKQQSQIVKGSGGYKSYNQPILHFGLGKINQIKSAKIIWPNGQMATIEQNLSVNAKYRITKIN